MKKIFIFIFTILCLITITACNEKEMFSITYTASIGGRISGPKIQEIANGENAEIVKAISEENYHFVKWSDGVTTEKRTDLNVTKNITVEAIFEKNDSSLKNKFTIIYTASAGGKISGLNIQEIVEGENAQTVTAVSEENYHFVRWSDGVKTETRNDSFIIKNMTVEAIFEKDVIIPQIKKYIVTYTTTIGGKISGLDIQEIVEGENTKVVTAISEEGYHFVKWSDGVTTETRTDLNVTNNITVEAIFERNEIKFLSFNINTNNIPIISKDDYIKCSVSVNDLDNPDYSFSNLEAKIKGRGNSTWGMPKKPYKLKFEEKINLFGNGKAKTWTLIANYCDQSLSRNYIAYKLANMLETNSVTSSTKFVELYLNNSYQGVYLVCEQVEVGDNRVEISKDYSNINTGYLIELDYKVYEEETVLGEDYFLCDNVPYAVKEPDKEDVQIKEYVKYIEAYFNECMKALKTSTFETVCLLIDVDSFAEGYIIQELFKNVDVKHSSWYLYKDKDGLLFNGPIWDMDITCGNCDYDNLTKIDYMYAKNFNPWYKLLFNFPEFRNIVKEKLIKNYYTMSELINDSIDELYLSKQYFDRNFTKWQTLGKYIWPNPQALVRLKTWEEHIEQVRKWLNDSLYYMFNEYCVEN